MPPPWRTPAAPKGPQMGHCGDCRIIWKKGAFRVFREPISMVSWDIQVCGIVVYLASKGWLPILAMLLTHH
jgi:hypothetical protein